MLKKIFRLAVLAAVAVPATGSAQLFKTKDRMDNLEGFDANNFSWGFFLSGNYFDYKLVLDPKYGTDGDKNAVLVKGSAGFGAGLIGRMRLDDSFDLRLEPGLQFVQREFTFNTENNAVKDEPNWPEFSGDKIRTVKSTYLDLPLLLEYHGDRWYNSRPYAAAGVNYIMNLQSNEVAEDDNSKGVFRSTTHNFGWSVEAGMQFYFKRFKLTPGFRGTFILNNELVKDNPGTPPYWAGAISRMNSRAFMFVLKFE